MKREPSLHITRSDFEEICKDIFPDDSIIDYNWVVHEVFKRAKSRSISTRTVALTNQQLEKKAKRLIQSSRNDADLFAKLIYAVRKKLKHRGISQIKPGGKDWDLIKEITAHALDFCLANDLPKRLGFLSYIEIGLKKLNKYNLSKFPSLQESINETYLALKEINDDNDSSVTEEIYRTYFSRIMSNTGIPDNSKDIPEKFVWFVRAKKEALELGVKPSTYMDAQFEALDFVNGIPHPTQLVGPKARDRVIRYLYKNNIKVGNTGSKKNWLNMDKINSYEEDKAIN